MLTMAALLYGAALFLQPNGFISPEGRRGADGYSHMLFRAYLHHSVHTDRRLPLWCPFVGGGYPIFAHPADDSLTPFAVPVLLFGEILGVKINMALLSLLGALGVYLLARRQLKMGEPGAMFSALAYLAAGWFPSMMLAGAYANAFFHLTPLILLLFFRAFRDWRYALPAGLLAALLGMVHPEGLLTLSFFALLLALGGTFSLPPSIYRLHGRPWPALAVLLVAALGFGAVKFIGLCQLEREAARRSGAVAGNDTDRDPHAAAASYRGLGHFGRSLVSAIPRRAEYDDRGRPQNDEYGWLGIPWLVLPMFPFGVWFLRRRSLPWCWAGSVFLLLCFGFFAAASLQRLPLWPPRSAPFAKYGGYYLLLVMTLLSGGALEQAAAWLKKKPARTLVTTVVFTSLLPFAFQHASLLYALCETEIVQQPPADEFYQVKTEYNPDPEAGADAYRGYPRPVELSAYQNLKRGIGTIDWYADLYLAENAAPRLLISPTHGTSKDNPDYRGEAFFADERNRVKAVTIDGNRIEVTVRVATPDRLIVNQNYHRGWQSDQGRPAVENGLLSVELRRMGDYPVRFRFAPASFRWGLDITILTFVLAALAWRHGRPRRRSADR